VGGEIAQDGMGDVGGGARVIAVIAVLMIGAEADLGIGEDAEGVKGFHGEDIWLRWRG